MKNLILLVILLAASMLHSYTQKEYYPNGNLKVEGEINQNGDEIGVWNHFSTTGKLIYVDTYDMNGNLIKYVRYDGKYENHSVYYTGTEKLRDYKVYTNGVMTDHKKYYMGVLRWENGNDLWKYSCNYDLMKTYKFCGKLNTKGLRVGNWYSQVKKTTIQGKDESTIKLYNNLRFVAVYDSSGILDYVETQDYGMKSWSKVKDGSENSYMICDSKLNNCKSSHWQTWNNTYTWCALGKFKLTDKYADYICRNGNNLISNCKAMWGNKTWGNTLDPVIDLYNNFVQ